MSIIRRKQRLLQGNNLTEIYINLQHVQCYGLRREFLILCQTSNVKERKRFLCKCLIVSLNNEFHHAKTEKTPIGSTENNYSRKHKDQLMLQL